MRVWGLEVDDPVSAQNARRIFVAHTAVSCCGALAVVWGVALAFGVAPKFQELKAEPVQTAVDSSADDNNVGGSKSLPGTKAADSNGIQRTAGFTGGYVSENDKDSACRRNGKWHDAQEDSLLSFVCQGPCGEAPYGSTWEIYNQSCYFHMEVPSHVSHREAEMICKSKKSQLAQILTGAMNKVVQRVCGPRECWIDLRQRPHSKEWVWGDGTAPVFQNWEEGEPNGGAKLRKAAFLNWGGSCKEYYGQYDVKQTVAGLAVDESWRVEHQVALERQRMSVALWALLLVLAPLGLLMVARMVLETKNANLAQCVCICDGLGTSCLAVQCLLSLLSLVVLFSGRVAVHGQEVADYRRGGPVKCAQDPGSLGYDSVEDCESAFSRQLSAFYIFLALVSFVALLLCLCGMSSAQQVHIRLRTANPVGAVTFPGGTYRAGTVQPPSTSGTAGVVVGAPVAAQTIGDVADRAEEDGVGFMSSWHGSAGVAAGTVVAGQQVLMESPPQPVTKTVD